MGIDGAKGTENWIEHIVDKVKQCYTGRKVVLWGRYPVSDDIKRRLKEKYGIEAAFYVDSDADKIDNDQVCPVDCLEGKASAYYVVIPIAFYQSVKDRMNEGGYRKELDYYYFNDCIIRDEEEYYEDAHGNRVIGKHRGLKFVFSGFRSQIEIGEDVCFRNTSIYLHNDCRVSIGNNTNLWDSEFHMSDFSDIYAKRLHARSGALLQIREGSHIQSLSMLFYRDSKIILGENTRIQSDTYHKVNWEVGEAAVFEVGDNSRFHTGHINIHSGALLKIGKQFSIGPRYEISADCYTDISIGDDCMFSWEIEMLSSDGHSIFNISTGENINFNKNRKIEIGNHVWVGMRTALLYNAKIGDGSVVGACSLVKGMIPNNCIAVGLPAKVVRKNIAWCEENCAENIMECGQEYINDTIE